MSRETFRIGARNAEAERRADGAGDRGGRTETRGDDRARVPEHGGPRIAHVIEVRAGGIEVLVVRQRLLVGLSEVHVEEHRIAAQVARVGLQQDRDPAERKARVGGRGDVENRGVALALDVDRALLIRVDQVCGELELAVLEVDGFAQVDANRDRLAGGHPHRRHRAAPHFDSRVGRGPRHERCATFGRGDVQQLHDRDRRCGGQRLRALHHPIEMQHVRILVIGHVVRRKLGHRRRRITVGEIGRPVDHLVLVLDRRAIAMDIG